MPLPRPREGETRDEFISRFMSDEEMKKEFKDTKQRVAVALKIWRDRRKRDKDNG